MKFKLKDKYVFTVKNSKKLKIIGFCNSKLYPIEISSIKEDCVEKLINYSMLAEFISDYNLNHESIYEIEIINPNKLNLTCYVYSY